MSFNITGVAAMGGPLAGGVNRWRAGRKKSATGETITSMVMTVGASMLRVPTKASAGLLTLATAGQSAQPWQSGLWDCGCGSAGVLAASAQPSGIAVPETAACEFEPIESSRSTKEPDWGQKSPQATAGPTVIAAARIIVNMRRQTLITAI